MGTFGDASGIKEILCRNSATFSDKKVHNILKIVLVYITCKVAYAFRRSFSHGCLLVCVLHFLPPFLFDIECLPPMHRGLTTFFRWAKYHMHRSSSVACLCG